MKLTELFFSEKKVNFYFDIAFSSLEKIVSQEHAILLTDQNMFNAYADLFNGWNTIIIQSGELFKQQQTINEVIAQLIEKEANKSTWLIGVGGGVVTDIAGFVGGIYMRGIKTGFVPTTLLAMVDASIGGKNGINVGKYKNMVGMTKQPDFLLYDYDLLNKLPQQEWANGFAEIIKHACIKDESMFEELEAHSIEYYQSNKIALAALIEKNIFIKSSIVQIDEIEDGDRKLLNFGHTIGHAIETAYNLPHGNAISIGMVYALQLSKEITGFSEVAISRVEKLLMKYHLPLSVDLDKEKIWQLIKMDKKRANTSISYILLEKIGKGIIHDIQLTDLRQRFEKITLIS